MEDEVMYLGSNYLSNINCTVNSWFNNTSSVLNVSFNLIDAIDNILLFSQKRKCYSHVKPIVESMHEASYFKTVSDKKYYYANQNFYDLIGIDTKKNISGLTTNQLISVGCNDKFRKILNDVNHFEAQAVINNEDILNEALPAFLDLNGNVIFLNLNIILVRDDNKKACGFLVQFLDNTKNISTETLLEKYYQLYSSKQEAIKNFLEHIGLASLLSQEGETLTKRELDCLIQLSKGNTAKETARALNISHRTVETHLGNIKLKFNMQKKTEVLSVFLKSNSSA